VVTRDYLRSELERVFRERKRAVKDTKDVKDVNKDVKDDVPAVGGGD
jgi:hypothetical protein